MNVDDIGSWCDKCYHRSARYSNRITASPCDSCCMDKDNKLKFPTNFLHLEESENWGDYLYVNKDVDVVDHRPKEVCKIFRGNSNNIECADDQLNAYLEKHSEYTVKHISLCSAVYGQVVEEHLAVVFALKEHS